MIEKKEIIRKKVRNNRKICDICNAVLNVCIK